MDNVYCLWVRWFPDSMYDLYVVEECKTDYQTDDDVCMCLLNSTSAHCYTHIVQDHYGCGEF